MSIERNLNKIYFSENYIKLLIILLFTTAFYRTAWVSEDAFITFRVIDNALSGLGLVWNPGERVQAFTHPLWFFILLPFVFFSQDPYYSTILISYFLLLITLITITNINKNKGLWIYIPIIGLLYSKSFIDYSSSGLENPLTHTLLAIFFWVWIYRKSTFLLTTIASGLFLCRPDAILLIAPAILLLLNQEKKWKGFLFGILPVVAWTAFSLFYYGSPVPNTALAKVGTNLSAIDKAIQAINYIKWSYEYDAITIALIIIGLVCGFLEKSLRVFSFGILLFFLYLFYVGSDYMGGRFFSPPVLLSVLLIATANIKKSFEILSVLLMFCVGSLTATLFSPVSFSVGNIINGIANERGFYYQYLGLSPVIRAGSWKIHPWFRDGEIPEGLYTRCAIGMSGYSGGRNIYWIDPLALTEPFLARLPSRNGARVGHYERALPEGYLESIISGENRISDPALKSLFDDVTLATKTSLFDPKRITAIWRLNTGFHKNAAANMNRNAIGLPGVPVITDSSLSCFGIPYGGDYSWKIEGIPAVAKPVVR